MERQAKTVRIHQIGIEEIKLPRVVMTVSCSKGTYIRTLCHDIGQKLGCGACMESLLRVRVGRFAVGESLRLAQIEQLRDSGVLAQYIIPVEEMFSGYPKVRTVPEADTMAHNGNPLQTEQVRFEGGCAEGGGCAGSAGCAEDGKSAGPEDGREYRIYDSRGVFLGIYAYERAGDRLRPRKMFLARDGV